jgi:3-phosphoshikimate 1-carboxyvinyltransferase
MAEISVAHSSIRGSVAGGELIVRMIDEIPAVCALAAVSRGQTEIRDAAELRVKESDRIATMAEVLGAFGVPCEELPDGMIISGGEPLHGARIESRGDHRIAMSAALLGLLAEGESLIDGAEAVDTSFPGFVTLMRSLGADIMEETL